MKALLFIFFAAFLSFSSQNAFAQSVLDQMNKKAEENTAKIITPSLPFDEEATKEAWALGDVTIKGVLYSKESKSGPGFYTIGGNDPQPAAKKKVYIYPVTPYYAEYLKLYKQYRDYKGKQKIRVQFDERINQYAAYAETDEYGRFSFEKMKPGRYYIYSDVVLQGTKNVDKPYAYDNYGNVYTQKQQAFWSADAFGETEFVIKENDKTKEVEIRLYFIK